METDLRIHQRKYIFRGWWYWPQAPMVCPGNCSNSQSMWNPWYAIFSLKALQPKYSEYYTHQIVDDVNFSYMNIDLLKVVGLMDAILTARATLVTAVQWVKRDNSSPSSRPSPKIWDWVQDSSKNPRGINLNKQCTHVDKCQIFYWSSQTALGSGNCLLFVVIMLKNLKTALF